jgi:hypothetical protein
MNEQWRIILHYDLRCAFVKYIYMFYYFGLPQLGGSTSWLSAHIIFDNSYSHIHIIRHLTFQNVVYAVRIS